MPREKNYEYFKQQTKHDEITRIEKKYAEKFTSCGYTELKKQKFFGYAN